MDTRFNTYVDEVTDGLKDDPELRLDVRAEFLNHLEETAGDEDAGEALRAFGPPEEVAKRLVTGNLRRMKARALVRIALRAVLVPAAILIALMLGYGGIVRAVDLISLMNRLSDFNSTGSTVKLPHLPWSKPLIQRLDALNQIPMVAAGQDVQRCYTLWQTTKDPSTSRVLYATYAFMLLKDGNIHLPTFERAMREGERVDPDNALYHYLLADAYFSKAIEEESPPTIVSEDKRAHVVIYHYNYRLLDRAMLEKGIREFEAGLTKPVLRTYHAEMQRLQFAAMPAPRHSEDYLDRIALSAATLLPELAKYRALAQKFPYAGFILMREGRTAEGERLLRAWKPYTEHLLGDSSPLLIQYLVAAAVTSDSSETCAQQYEALGRPADARQIRQEAKRCLQPYRNWRAHLHDRNPNEEQILRQSGMLASVMLPVMGADAPQIDPRKLAPTRRLDQTWLEIVGASGLVVLLALAMLCVAAVALFTSLGGKSPEEKPLLILPGWKELARILGLGVLLPLAVYYLVTRSGIDGRQYGFKAEPWRAYLFSGELIMLGGVLLVVPLVLAKRALDYRCRALGIAGSRFALPRNLVFVLGIIGALAANALLLFLVEWGMSASHISLSNDFTAGATVVSFCLLLAGDFYGVRALFRRLYRTPMARPPASPVLLLVLGILGMLLVSLVIFALLAASLDMVQKWSSDAFALVYFTVLTSTLLAGDAFWLYRYARCLFRPAPEPPPAIHYPGTMARSLVFIYALVIVFTAVLVFPVLNATERALLRQDTVLLPRPGDGLSPIEAQVTEHLRQQLLVSFEERK